MEKKRIYLDYNATTPLADSVKDWLRGDITFLANPSSVHTSGKKAKRDIDKTKDFLFKTFGLDQNVFDLFFHSGATEGINTVVKGHASSLDNMTFLYHGTDHSCVYNLTGCLEKMGHQSISYDYKDIEKSLKTEASDHNRLINLTWVNNETGIINSFDSILSLKDKYNLKIHVDAVQSIGKIKDWSQLDSRVDAYTFSGHKFGALKGIGFTFMKKDFSFHPLLRGGGQQAGLRSGTENTIGIYSLKIALEEMLDKYNFDNQNIAKEWFEDKLCGLIGDKGEIIGKDVNRNGNTIYFILYETKAQTSAMALDMAGFDVSNGSACSSGAVLPSRVLLHMGYSEEYAKSAVRLSFSSHFEMQSAQKYWEGFEKVISRFL
jgi:cysteine desulfurase